MSAQSDIGKGVALLLENRNKELTILKESSKIENIQAVLKNAADAHKEREILLKNSQHLLDVKEKIRESEELCEILYNERISQKDKAFMVLHKYDKNIKSCT